MPIRVYGTGFDNYDHCHSKSLVELPFPIKYSAERVCWGDHAAAKGLALVRAKEYRGDNGFLNTVLYSEEPQL